MDIVVDHSALETAVIGYFRKPDPLGMVALFAAEPVTERWRAQTVLTLPVFLALVMDAQPPAAAALVDAIRGGDPVKVEMVAQALNYSHHAERRRLMERLVGEHAAGGMDPEGAVFTDFLPTHPVHVDMLWAAFFATGDASYVTRIAGLLAGWMPEPQLQPLLAVAARDEAVAQRAMAGVLAGAAQVSLAVNARDLVEVREALEAFAARQDGLSSAMAARILAGK
ncbi:MAG: hypothetical protein H7Y60_06025 [Rhodospirillaceae bacterium]|nr:hypothetical protein [Rhodospirillales bacterium]